MPKLNGKLMRRRNLILSLGVILVLVAAACGGGDEDETPTVPQPTSTPEEAANNPPTADFTFTPDAVPRGDNFQTVVTFTATASDPDGDPLTFQWTFKSGNPGTATGDVVTSSFPGVAPYTVTLTVSDGRGGEVTVTKTVPLGEPTPTPVPEEVMEEVAIVQTTEHPELGTILTDANGFTLYLFLEDELNQSNCLVADGCATIWPPLLTTGDPVASEGANPDLLGTITRDDGSTQVTYNGRPLYNYIVDQNPGDATGQGVVDFGKWYVVSPQGQPVQTTVTLGVVVALNDLIGEGQFGVATLTATANMTLVVINVIPGAPENDPQPIHIHSGSCGPELGGVDYPLTDIVEGVSVTLVDVSLDSIRDGNHVINIHESFPEIATYTSCGNIPTVAESVSITLDELDGSGQSGTATLVDQGSVTLVAIAVTPGLPGDDPQPVHIHSGSCGPGLGGVDYPLTDIVEGVSVTLVDATLESIRDGNHVINAHKSFPEIGTYTSCGYIPGQSEQTNISDDSGGGGYSY